MCVHRPIEITSFILSFTSEYVPLALTADKLLLVMTLLLLSDRDVSHTTDIAAPTYINLVVD